MSEQEEVVEQEKDPSCTVALTWELLDMLKAVAVGASDLSETTLIGVELTLRPDGCLEAVCTDSYILVHREIDLGHTGLETELRVLVHANNLRRALKMAVSRGWYVDHATGAHIAVSPAGVTVESESVSASIPAMDGDFPSWQEIVRKGLAAGTGVDKIVLDPRLLARARKALGAHMPVGALRLEFSGSQAPVKCVPQDSPAGAPNWVLVMPCREA